MVEGLRVHAGEPREHLHRRRLPRRAGDPRLGDRQRAALLELRAGPRELPDAVAELATFLRQVAPNQLIADGGDGFDDDPTPYVGLSNFYAVRGDEGASFSRLGRVDALDMLSYHFYPRNYGFTTASDTEIWIERHQAIARAHRQGRLPGRVRLRRRRTPSARRTTTAGCATCSRAAAGSWACSGSSRRPARANNDGFAVYSRRDNATAWILARWGKALQ